VTGRGASQASLSQIANVTTSRELSVSSVCKRAGTGGALPSHPGPEAEASQPGGALGTEWLRTCLPVFMLGTAAAGVAIAALAWRDLLPLEPRELRKDAAGYFTLGQNWFEQGVYSRAPRPPYVPDVTRPPLYPVFVYATWSLAGLVGVYAFQALLHGASAACVAVLARRAGASVRWASLAGAAYALDLAALELVPECLTETLSIDLMLGALALLAVGLSRDRLGWFAAAGVVFGLSALTRPLADKVALACAGATLLAPGKGLRSRLAMSATLLAGLLLTICPWLIRNYRILGRPTLSVIADVNLAYYVGALPYQIVDGLDHRAAREPIRKQHGLASYRDLQNPWLSALPAKELYKHLRRRLPSVLLDRPGALLTGVAYTAVRRQLEHSARFLTKLLFGDALGARQCLILAASQAAPRARCAAGAVVALTGWQILAWVAALACAIAGAYTCLRKPDSWRCVLLAAVIVLLLSTLAFGLGVGVRARVPAEPVVYALAAVGLDARRGS